MAVKVGKQGSTVGLISDTHGFLDPALREVFAKVDQIVHAGDIGTEAVLEELGRWAPTMAVRGNIDGGPLRFLPLESQVEVEGVRIASLHIAGSPKRPKPAALELIRRLRPQVLVVGHSHIPVVGRVKGTLWINPGAAGRVGFHQERFAALLHIAPDGSLSMDRVALGSRTKGR